MACSTSLELQESHSLPGRIQLSLEAAEQVGEASIFLLYFTKTTSESISFGAPSIPVLARPLSLEAAERVKALLGMHVCLFNIARGPLPHFLLPLDDE